MNLRSYTFWSLLCTNLVFACILCPVQSKAQWVFSQRETDSIISITFEQIYSIEFDKASRNTHILMSAFPDHPSGFFLDALLLWWKMLLEPANVEYKDVFLERLQKTIDVSNQILSVKEQSPMALFFKGGAYGYRGRYYSNKGIWNKASTDVKIAFETLNEVKRIAPNNHDVMLGTGLFNYFVEVLPEEYPVLSVLLYLFPKGDKQLGILQLKSAAEHSKYSKTEAKFSLLQIFANLEQRPQEALMLAEELYSMYPNNAVFHRYVAKSNYALSNVFQAEQVWKEIIMNYKKQKPGYDIYLVREALYYVGELLFLQEEYGSAIRYFLKCEEASQRIDGTNSKFRSLSLIRIGNIYDLLLERETAIGYYSRVLSWDDNYTSHELAKKYLVFPFRLATSTTNNEDE
ncbi:MAG: hypothetical protein JNL36_01420 [Candidatus Kapabacteria bacterium]|nr:hypothetical protein [Candidatus Kapabacteria bacterium]